MKAMKLAYILIFLMICSIPAYAGDQLSQTTGTQENLNKAASKNLKAAEAEMIKIFDSLLLKAQGKADAIAKLHKSQSAWEAYRDAQLEVYWPFPERSSYGSVYPMCFAIIKKNLTEARNNELRAMLSPEEGDSCGSQWPY